MLSSDGIIFGITGQVNTEDQSQGICLRKTHRCKHTENLVCSGCVGSRSLFWDIIDAPGWWELTGFLALLLSKLSFENQGRRKDLHIVLGDGSSPEPAKS